MSEQNSNHESRITALEANIKTLTNVCTALIAPIHNLQKKMESVFPMIESLSDGLVKIQVAQTTLTKWVSGPDGPQEVRDAVAQMERSGEVLEKNLADLKKLFSPPDAPPAP